MQILSQTVFSGPNIIGLFPAARLVVAGPPDLFSPLGDAIRRRLDELFRQGLRSDGEGLALTADTLAGLVGELALLLQRANRHPVKRGSLSRLVSGYAEVGFEIARASVVPHVVECIEALLGEGLGECEPGTFDRAYRGARRRLGFRLTDLFIHDRLTTASRLGVPARVESGRRVYVGQGEHTRLTSGGYTESTSRLGKDLAGDKARSSRLLADWGLPAAEQRSAESAEGAVRAARSLGYPVVLKPRGGNKGRGVAVDLTEDDEVRAAYAAAEKIDPDVVVERYIAGDDYRLLVINGRFVAAVRRLPAHVTGDGTHSIRQLMELANERERRDGLYLFPLRVDAEVERVLRAQGLDLGFIPPAGRRVLLRRAANQSLGGTTEDVTDRVHPDNRAAAVAAARACLLDVAGIDFVTTDISRSWRSGFGAIIEINAGPGVDLHMCPTQGVPQAISWHLIRACLPARNPGRIPVVMVTGRYEKQTVSGWIGTLLGLCGHRVGMYVGRTLSVAGRRIDQPAAAGVAGAVGALLSNRDIDAAVIEMSLLALLWEGVPLDRTAVNVITDAHPSSRLITESFDEDILPRIHHLVAGVACQATVIDAGNAELRRAMAHVPPPALCYVWADPDGEESAVVCAHLQAGGWAVLIERGNDGRLWVVRRHGSDPPGYIIPLEAILSGERDESRLRERLMACAAVLAAGVPVHLLAAPLGSLAAPVSEQSTLLVDAGRAPAVAAADPRERAAAARLAALHRLRPGRGGIRIVVAADASAADDLAQPVRALDGPGTLWCVAGEDRAGTATVLAQHAVAPERIVHSADLESAWLATLRRARADDTVVLLALDDALRTRLFRTSAQVSAVPDAATPGTLWSARALADLFDGAWVSGPGAGWGIDDLAWGCDGVRPGDLAIIPGRPDHQPELPALEAGVAQAVARGAAAVITPSAPSDLPRWHAVLVCDSPLAGLERLAEAARYRFGGKVVGVAGEEAGRVASALAADWEAQGAGMSVFHDHRGAMADDASIATLLALARTPADLDAAIYALPEAYSALALVQPDLWIAVASTAAGEERMLSALAFLSPGSDVLALVPSGRAREWEARAEALGLGRCVVVARGGQGAFEVSAPSVPVAIPDVSQSGEAIEVLSALAQWMLAMLRPDRSDDNAHGLTERRIESLGYADLPVRCADAEVVAPQR